MRVVGRTAAAEFPVLRRQYQRVQLTSHFPPMRPEARCIVVRKKEVFGGVGRFEESGQSEKYRFGCLRITAQSLQCDSLRQNEKWHLVPFVAKGSCQRLKQCF